MTAHEYFFYAVTLQMHLSDNKYLLYSETPLTTFAAFDCLSVTYGGQELFQISMVAPSS